MNKFLFFLIAILGIVFISLFLPGYFSSADSLYHLPSYGSENFSPPKNSLIYDPVVQFEPWRQFAKMSLTRGVIPVWNKYNAGGVPFLANPQTSIFYPLNLLYDILPLQAGLYSLHLIKIFSFGFFTYLYLRVIKRSRLSSFIGSVTAASSGFIIVWLQWPQTNVYIFFPLLFYITEKIYSDEKKDYLKYFSVLTIVYFLSILGGHPETLFHLLLLHMSYSIFRLGKEKKKILLLFLAIFSAFSLSAFMIIPFTEYLFQSSVLVSRGKEMINFYLSPLSFSQFYFPFLSGAPHLAFYRTLNPETNFQEGIGAYVGSVVFTLAIVGFIKKNHIPIIKFWAVASVLILLLVYKVWPVTIVNLLPVFSLSVNVRLVGFLVLGFVSSFAFILDDLIQAKKLYKNSILKKTLIILTVLTFFIFAGWIFSSQISFTNQIRVSQFISFLFGHIAFVFFTSTVFVVALFLKDSTPRISRILLILSIASQTITLFWNYNPVITAKDFYPKTELVGEIEKHPLAPIIEIGDMNFPENINLMYMQEHAFNYDAINVRSRSTEFQSLFPRLNRWGRIDVARTVDLEKLGIKYVISDYDIRLMKTSISGNPSTIIPPKGDSLGSISFLPETDEVRSIRMMFVTYNRKNTCIISFQFSDEKTKSIIYKKNIPCSNVSNYMFFTLPIPKGLLKKHSPVNILIYLQGATTSNRVALVGEKGRPYMETLSAERNYNKDATPIWSNEILQLFELPGDSLLRLSGSYKVVNEAPDEYSFKVLSKKNQTAVLLRTMYPGWNVFIDGKSKMVDRKGYFISFYLPEGQHIVHVAYQPLSLFLGTIISGITFIVFLIIFLRYIFRQKNTHQYWVKWRNLAMRVGNIPWYAHSIVILLSIFLATGIYLVLVCIFKPIFTMPTTDTINWYTVHHYPRQMDYFYLIAGVCFVFLFSCLTWIFWLCLKNKK